MNAREMTGLPVLQGEVWPLPPLVAHRGAGFLAPENTLKAFATAAAFMFGDHLGFVAGVNATMILPMICAKLVCGLTALCLANLLAPRLLAKAASAAENAAG